MEEREIEKILKPKKKLMILFLIFLGFAIVFIGGGFFMKFANQEEEQSVQLEIDTPPILMLPALEDTYFYYVVDINHNSYIVNLSDTTFSKIIETVDAETGKLKNTYALQGTMKPMDESIQNLVLLNAIKVFEKDELNADNFSENLGKYYVKENFVDERMITLYKISALTGVFFLVVAFGYLLPGILKVRKTLKDEDLLEELRTELQNLTDMPYKKQHLYLTRNYVVFGIQAIKYEEIVWAYCVKETSYGINVGENLVVHTKDNQKHIVASIAGMKSDVLKDILADLKRKNEGIRIGYHEE